ncbi:MAG: hypothetical protein AAFY64_06040, partial [Pseudomonadota bacterium]
MPRKKSPITITSRVIDIGDTMIAVAGLTRSAIGRDPARVRQTNTAFLIALLAAGAAASAFRMQINEVMIGSGVVAVIALLRGLYLLRKRSLFLITSDGRSSVLLEDDDDFMRDVLKIVREAVAGKTAPDAVYEIDRISQQIVRRGSTVAASSISMEHGETRTDEPNSAPSLNVGTQQTAGEMRMDATPAADPQTQPRSQHTQAPSLAMPPRQQTRPPLNGHAPQGQHAQPQVANGVASASGPSVGLGS